MNSNITTKRDTRKLAEYRSARRLVRIVVMTGIAASVAANVIGAADAIEVGVAAWPPLALLLAIEILIRVPVTGQLATIVRILGTLGVAGAAGYLSYFRMAATVSQHGEHGVSAKVWPISVDGLMVVAAVSLVALDGLIRELEARIEDAATVVIEHAVPAAPAAVVEQAAPVSPGAPAAPLEPAEVIAFRAAMKPLRHTSALTALRPAQ
jgi:hypothetical protein